MLEEFFQEVYIKFKLNFYTKIFARFETREASLTAVETFCAETISALGSPTINEFAQFTKISAQNATHKVNSLVRKGYISKTQSPEDRREFRLTVTEKFLSYYNINASYVHEVAGRMADRFTKDELDAFGRVLQIISTELMPEISLGGRE
ncbi:MAG: MarR family transcriptional regulator [Oscillospiraceae bacterium]|jgi:DNA-binding MarR family transcriptional regulator|nr:MarR family transcriptional regulator [Oscillospiraceae bacterium]